MTVATAISAVSPPVHWVTARQRATPSGRRWGSSTTVSAVVEKPADDSKRASSTRSNVPEAR
jgi:hypothetical protein